MSLHYTPAGVEGWMKSNQLYVRYKTNTVESSRFGHKYKEWRLRDRTLAMTSNTAKGGLVPLELYDAAASVNSAAFAHACGITKVLANPIHGEYSKQDFAALGIESIVDSGGFQMLKGTVDFVSPDDVIARYQACADIGMPLDLPIPADMEPEFWDPVSRLIKANDDYIGARLDPKIDLALISHGTTLEKRRRRLDILDRPAKVVAVAGLNIRPAPGIDHQDNSIENLMYVTHRYRKQARHFHVLGVTSKLWLFVYALLSESGWVKSIGADSVSHRLAALVGDYETMDFDLLELPKDLKYRRYPSCGCPVCTMTSDLRIVSNYVLLEAHNLWVRAAQTRMIEEMAGALLKDQIKLSEVNDVLKLKQKPMKLQRLVNYTREIIASGRFKPLKSDAQSQSLFGSSDVAPVDSVSRERLTSILKSYEDFHKKKFL